MLILYYIDIDFPYPFFSTGPLHSYQPMAGITGIIYLFVPFHIHPHPHRPVISPCIPSVLSAYAGLHALSRSFRKNILCTNPLNNTGAGGWPLKLLLLLLLLLPECQVCPESTRELQILLIGSSSLKRL